MAMYDITWLDQLILMVLWVLLLYALFGLALGWLALTNLEWRQLIKARLRERWRGLKLRLALAGVNLWGLTLRGFRWLRN